MEVAQETENGLTRLGGIPSCIPLNFERGLRGAARASKSVGIKISEARSRKDRETGVDECLNILGSPTITSGPWGSVGMRATTSFNYNYRSSRSLSAECIITYCVVMSVSRKRFGNTG
jgi:hypothetical protein